MVLNTDPYTDPDPKHCCLLLYLWFEVKDVIRDGQVVLQPEGGQQDPVLHGEGQPQLLF